CWRNRLASSWDRGWYALHAGVFGGATLEAMRSAGRARVLFAGNGISLMPYAFAHAGLDVTALDVSRVAADFVADVAIDARVLAALLPVHKTVTQYGTKTLVPDEAKSLERVYRTHRPGGVVRSVSADLFHHKPQAPYDVIASIMAFQGFDPLRREVL